MGLQDSCYAFLRVFILLSVLTVSLSISYLAFIFHLYEAAFGYDFPITSLGYSTQTIVFAILLITEVL